MGTTNHHRENGLLDIFNCGVCKFNREGTLLIKKYTSIAQAAEENNLSATILCDMLIDQSSLLYEGNLYTVDIDSLMDE